MELYTKSHRIFHSMSVTVSSEGCAPRRYGQICSNFHYAMCGYQHAKFWGFVVFGLQMECSINYQLGSCAPKITKCKLSLTLGLRDMP